ncbi:MAG: hemolysin family protein [Candidatus Margulisiibacteriota bacterium]
MLGIVALFILFGLSAFFSAVETAMTSISNIRIVHLVETQKPGAKTLRRLRENPAKLLSSILIGNNIVNISASVLATTIATDYFTKIGLGEGAIIGVVIGIITLFTLVFGEITPKTIAFRNAETISLLFAPPMVVFEWIIGPIEWLLTMISRPFVFLFGGRIPEQGPFITEDAIKALLYAGEKEGVIEKEEREMISSVFKFGDLKANDVMTPKEKIKSIDQNETVAQAIAKIKEHGNSRIPVYDNNINNIVGIVYAKDLLTVDLSQPVSEYMRPGLFIPGDKKIDDLLDLMRAEYKHLAIVVDELGQTAGLVTLEDLIEELVGEIHDEHERQK